MLDDLFLQLQTIVIVEGGGRREGEDQSVCVDHYSPHYLQPPILSQILKVTDTTTIRRQIESDTALPSLYIRNKDIKTQYTTTIDLPSIHEGGR